MREYFRAEGFLEVETPVFLDAPGFNAHIDEFTTEYRAARAARRLWLRTSPEVFHKRLLAAGETKIFEIGKFFRNGETGTLHNPEFSGLEFYEVGFDYRRIMERTEQVLARAMEAVAGTRTLTLKRATVDLATPWERLSVRDAVKRFAGIDLDAAPDARTLADAARAKGIHVAADDAYDDVFFRILLEKVEHRLGAERPTFLYDYPASMAAMARRKAGEPGWAERVELYIAGVELANGFSELTDPVEQRARFLEEREQQAKRLGVAADTLPLDEAFLGALSSMPPCTGIA
ncbi:MAG TPA: EF-P lysine aminoacylase EpmA, partial [bacterium]|nr:EF-P lysine aminoacylase EpmA [bacterium]